MPVGPTLEGLLGVDSLSGLVQVFSDDTLHTTLSGLFEQGRKLESDGETCKWDEEQFGRELAPVIGETSPAPISKQTALIPHLAEPLHIAYSVTIPGRKLFKQRAPGGLAPDAVTVVRSQTKNLHLKCQRTLEYASAKTLQGSLVVNNTNIPGSDQTFTVSYSPTTYAESASWSNAATLLNSSEMPALFAKALQGAELEPAVAFYSDVTEKSVLKNTEITNWWSKTPRADAFMQGGILDARSLNGLIMRGVEWRRVPGGYVPVGGSFTRYLDDGKIIVLPKQIDQVLGMFKARAVIPTDEREVFVGENAFGGIGLAPTPGWYAYAYREKRPPSITIVVGFLGLPVLMNALGVCVATTT